MINSARQMRGYSLSVVMCIKEKLDNMQKLPVLKPKVLSLFTANAKHASLFLVLIEQIVHSYSCKSFICSLMHRATKKTPVSITWILRNCFNFKLFLVILSWERELCILLTLYFCCSDMSMLPCVSSSCDANSLVEQFPA